MSDPFYEEGLRPSLAQGDILANVRCVSGTRPDGDLLTVMILTHDCEIDKANGNTSCLAARVRRFERESERIRDNIRRGETRSALYLPPDELVGEGFVNLRQVFEIPFEAIAATRFNGDGQRLVDWPHRLRSLSDLGRKTLWGAIAMFYMRTSNL